MWILLICWVVVRAAERGYKLPKAETGLPAAFPGNLPSENVSQGVISIL